MKVEYLFFHQNTVKLRQATLYVTTFCLHYFKGFSVIRTFDVTETAEYILRLTDKLKREKEKYGFYHSKFVEKPKTYTRCRSPSEKAKYNKGKYWRDYVKPNTWRKQSNCKNYYAKLRFYLFTIGRHYQVIQSALIH